MSKMNIILITVDSWNRNVVDCLNTNTVTKNLTPNLDKFAEKCHVFEYSFCQGVKTSASVLSILSGYYPSKYSDWYSTVSDKRIMIQELLLKKGYYTIGFTSNPCTSSLRNYQRGFIHFKDNISFKNAKGFKLKAMLALKSLFKNPYYPAEKLNAQVFNALENVRQPYFMWIHYMDLHGPYIGMKGFQFIKRLYANQLWKKATTRPNKIDENEKQELIKNYREKMKYLDYHLGELFEHVDLKQNIIILSGDHGDIFGERGYYGHPFLLYNEMINVPLFIKTNKHNKNGMNYISIPVSLMDIVPTLLEILNINDNRQRDGVSLNRLIENASQNYISDRPIITEISRKFSSIIFDNWKLIANIENDTYLLFDLKSDPNEKKNIFNEYQNLGQHLKKLLINHFRD